MMRYLLLLCLWVAACGSDGSSKAIDFPPADEDVSPFPPRNEPIPGYPALQTAPTRSYPEDHRLRLNQIQMKGSHNSYHLASNASNPPEWTQYSLPPLAEQLAQYGVRQFELDIHYYKKRFVVFHLPEIDQRTTCFEFTTCLREMNDWSYNHPGHHPIIVWLELKDEWDPEKIPPHIEELDEAVLSVIPRWKLITPDDVQRGFPTLSEAIAEHGWPTLAESRGKFLFVVMNEGEGRYVYTRGGTSLAGRAMFVTDQGWPYGVVAMIDDVVNQEHRITEAVAAGMLVRSRVDDLPGRGANYANNLKIALRAGAHMIATDYPVPDTIPGYSVVMPGGLPSRCNPVTAPDFCRSEYLENPLLLRPVP
jgi:hypothetical protein